MQHPHHSATCILYGNCAVQFSPPPKKKFTLSLTGDINPQRFHWNNEEWKLPIPPKVMLLETHDKYLLEGQTMATENLAKFGMCFLRYASKHINKHTQLEMCSYL